MTDTNDQPIRSYEFTHGTHLPVRRTLTDAAITQITLASTQHRYARVAMPDDIVSAIINDWAAEREYQRKRDEESYA